MEFKSHVFFSKLYEELQFRLRRLRLERRRLSARLRRPFFSCEPVSASGASSHRLALFEVVRRLTRFRTHDCGDSALCESRIFPTTITRKNSCNPHVRARGGLHPTCS